jgi:hypothetical protein
VYVCVAYDIRKSGNESSMSGHPTGILSDCLNVRRTAMTKICIPWVTVV